MKRFTEIAAWKAEAAARGFEIMEEHEDTGGPESGPCLVSSYLAVGRGGTWMGTGGMTSWRPEFNGWIADTEAEAIAEFGPDPEDYPQ